MPRERHVAMITIEAAFARFLAAEAGRVSDRTLRTTKEVIELLSHCLNSYGYLELDAEDRARFDIYYNAEDGAHREFCDIFGPTYLLGNVEEFLGRFMIRKVICGKSLLTATGPTVARLVRWLAAEGLVDRAEAEYAASVASVLGRDLCVALAVTSRLHDLADEDDGGADDTRIEDGFVVSVIQSDAIYVEAEMTGEEYGPIQVPEDVASRLQIGWTFWASLRRRGDAWRLREIGSVYPERS